VSTSVLAASSHSARASAGMITGMRSCTWATDAAGDSRHDAAGFERLATGRILPGFPETRHAKGLAVGEGDEERLLTLPLRCHS